MAYESLNEACRSVYSASSTQPFKRDVILHRESRQSTALHPEARTIPRPIARRTSCFCGLLVGQPNHSSSNRWLDVGIRLKRR